MLFIIIRYVQKPLFLGLGLKVNNWYISQLREYITVVLRVSYLRIFLKFWAFSENKWTIRTSLYPLNSLSHQSRKWNTVNLNLSMGICKSIYPRNSTTKSILCTIHSRPNLCMTFLLYYCKYSWLSYTLFFRIKTK